MFVFMLILTTISVALGNYAINYYKSYANKKIVEDFTRKMRDEVTIISIDACQKMLHDQALLIDNLTRDLEEIKKL